MWSRKQSRLDLVAFVGKQGLEAGSLYEHWNNKQGERESWNVTAYSHSPLKPYLYNDLFLALCGPPAPARLPMTSGMADSVDTGRGEALCDIFTAYTA